jgi:ribosomal protein L39E
MMNDPYKVMVAGRGGGKTFELMKWVDAQENPENVAVVTNSDVEAKRLERAWMRKYPDPKRPRPRFVDMKTARSGALNGRHTRIVIDNVDILLSHLLPYPIDFITTTGAPHERARP